LRKAFRPAIYRGNTRQAVAHGTCFSSRLYTDVTGSLADPQAPGRI
jgi:hypothetical protein